MAWEKKITESGESGEWDSDRIFRVWDEIGNNGVNCHASDYGTTGRAAVALEMLNGLDGLKR